MLTDTQLEKLEPLTKHPRYGKLLNNAIETWKNYGIQKFSYGIFPIADQFQVDSRCKGCCLIGASIVNKKTDQEIYAKCASLYELNEKEVGAIIGGFDDLGMIAQNIDPSAKNAYDFGKNVSEMLFNG